MDKTLAFLILFLGGCVTADAADSDMMNRIKLLERKIEVIALAIDENVRLFNENVRIDNENAKIYISNDMILKNRIDELESKVNLHKHYD